MAHNKSLEKEDYAADEINGTKLTRVHKNHLVKDIIGNLNDEMKTREKKQSYVKMLSNVAHVCLTFKIEPKNVKKAFI